MFIISACGNASGEVQAADAETSASQRTNAISDTTKIMDVSGYAQNQEEENNGKVLVAYFSATGTTRSLAENTADMLEAALYEIKAETPYTCLLYTSRCV